MVSVESKFRARGAATVAVLERFGYERYVSPRAFSQFRKISGDDKSYASVIESHGKWCFWFVDGHNPIGGSIQKEGSGPESLEDVLSKFHGGPEERCKLM